MRYVKEFETSAQFNNFVLDSTNTPNVSLVEELISDNGGLVFTPYIATIPVTPPNISNGHEYIEIGGIKWATMNIGANSITDTGLYFQWGDTQGYTASQVGNGEGQKYFSDDDCIYYNNGSYTKYDEGDSKITLEASDDAVTAAWGGGWRMPTVSEFTALSEAVNTAWTDDYQGSGVAGIICTDKTDSSKVLFFPACGFADYGSVYDVGSKGGYWSSSLDAECGDRLAYNLYFFNGSVNWQNSDFYRCYGFPVRGVLAEN